MKKEIMRIKPDFANLRFCKRPGTAKREMYLEEHYIGYAETVGAELDLTLRVGSATFPCCSGIWRYPRRFADDDKLADFLAEQQFIVADKVVGTANWLPRDWSVVPAEYQADINDRCLASERRLGVRLEIERGEKERTE